MQRPAGLGARRVRLEGTRGSARKMAGNNLRDGGCQIQRPAGSSWREVLRGTSGRKGREVRQGTTCGTEAGKCNVPQGWERGEFGWKELAGLRGKWQRTTCGMEMLKMK